MGGRSRKALALWRAVAGKDTWLESAARRARNRARFALRGEFRTRATYAFRASDRSSQRLGIYALGSCDLFTVVECGPLIRQWVPGTCAIVKEGLAAQRSDILLQTLQPPSEEILRPTVQMLQLGDDYFRPILFEPDFTIPGHTRLGSFPKKVVALSVGPDLSRKAYRHREHGFLVDPGGWWLAQSLENVLARAPHATAWFARNFEKAGRITLDEFTDNFEKVVRLLQERTGAQVLVFNTLLVDPGNATHNYQLLRHPHSARRREFMLALTDLSRKLDFSIVDVDRLLKREGISTQADFAHFSQAQRAPVVREVVRVLREREVV